jgi:threonine dehydratase
MYPAITLTDIQSARARIASHVRRTPLTRSETLSGRLGTNVYLKAEVFQKTGSFKVRGAFNKMLNLGDAARSKGVVAMSGGNHAQAVAYAAKTLGLKALICMPKSTPKNYVDATRGYGAEIEFVDTAGEMTAAMEAYGRQGWAIVHPFDDPLVMAGQGTAGLEIMEDLPDTTDLIVSIGGGGLMGGLATALKSLKPNVRIWGVQTDGANAMAEALAAGHPVTIPAITSIARTLGAPVVSDETLRLAQLYLENVTVVTDAEAFAALRFLLARTKMLTEPAASCTLAAAERLRAHFGPDRHVVLFLCGGNLGVDDLCQFVSRFPTTRGDD